MLRKLILGITALVALHSAMLTVALPFPPIGEGLSHLASSSSRDVPTSAPSGLGEPPHPLPTSLSSSGAGESGGRQRAPWNVNLDGSIRLKYPKLEYKEGTTLRDYASLTDASKKAQNRFSVERRRLLQKWLRDNDPGKLQEKVNKYNQNRRDQRARVAETLQEAGLGSSRRQKRPKREQPTASSAQPTSESSSTKRSSAEISMGARPPKGTPAWLKWAKVHDVVSLDNWRAHRRRKQNLAYRLDKLKVERAKDIIAQRNSGSTGQASISQSMQHGGDSAHGGAGSSSHALSGQGEMRPDHLVEASHPPSERPTRQGLDFDLNFPPPHDPDP